MVSGESGQGSAFEIRLQPADSHGLLMLAGLVGTDAAPELCAKARVLVSDSKDVAIDWQDAEHVGASAIQVLLALGSALSRHGHKLYVIHDNPSVRRFLELSGLSAKFPVLEASIEAFR